MTAAMFRLNPSHFVRRMAVPCVRRFHSASSIAAHSSSVTSAISARGAKAGSVTFRANFTFHVHTSCQVCRDTRFLVALVERRERPPHAPSASAGLSRRRLET